MTEPKSEGQANEGDRHLAGTRRKMTIQKMPYVTTGKPISELHPASAAHQVAGQINRDRIHAHPDERPAPAAELENIHHPIKQAKQDRAVTASDQHVGGGPNLFDDRKLEIPTPAKHGCDHTCAEQINDFPFSLNRLVLQQKTCEHAQQASGNRRNSAEVTFRIEIIVVFLPRQVLEIEMIADIVTFIELPRNRLGGAIEEPLGSGPR